MWSTWIFIWKLIFFQNPHVWKKRKGRLFPTCIAQPTSRPIWPAPNPTIYKLQAAHGSLDSPRMGQISVKLSPISVEPEIKLNRPKYFGPALIFSPFYYLATAHKHYWAKPCHAACATATASSVPALLCCLLRLRSSAVAAACHRCPLPDAYDCAVAAN